MHTSGSLLALLQSNVAVPTGLTSNQVTIILIFAGVITIAVVLQCVMLMSFMAGAAKARKELVNMMAEVKDKALPVLQSTQHIVERVGPKVERAADNINEITEIARAKAVEIDSVTTEIAMRTRQRVRRVDEVISEAVDSVDHIRHQVFHAVMGPVKHIVGVLAGVKAGVEKAAQKFKGGTASTEHYTHVERDEMFGEGDDYTA